MTVRINRDKACAALACGIVGYATGVEPASLLAQERGAAQVASARQIAMYLAHTAFGMSYARVAIAFGRDRSTIGHACRVVEERREDPAFEDLLCALEASLREAPPPASPPPSSPPAARGFAR